MSDVHLTVDDAGLTLDPDLVTSCDVLFDDHHVWSFSPDEFPVRDDQRVVTWPQVMRSRLDGIAVVTVRCGDSELFADELQFGEGDERIRFVGKDGLPIMVDKWGLIQRPFSGRGEGVLEQMVEISQTIFTVLRDEFRIPCWIAFGSLLGAARSGKAIGYDSDIDLAYLSEKETPAEMAREMFAISRALRSAGLRVLNKSASFITVVFRAPDGGQSSIDLYTCFYLGDLLYETATVRAPVPREALLPLSTITFEGHQLPAPARPDVLLEASYGPNWRVPDPSFAHRPGHDIKSRFDPWFGSLMRQRRAWERALRSRAGTDDRWTTSSFNRWVRRRLPEGAPVIDVGTGDGADALGLAKHGWSVVGLDYARGPMEAAHRRASKKELPATFEQLNLYDLRDTLSIAALLARSRPAPRAVVARRVVDALEPDGLENFWRLVRIVAADGGSAYLEFGGPQPEPGPTAGGRRFPTTPDEVAARARAAGGRMRERVVTEEEGATLWRMSFDWPDGAEQR